jgi:ribonuclease D
MDNFWMAINTCTWVLHSARQDIEVIYQTAGFMPAAIFDTQIAAGLLGFAPQMGYAGLIRELFDVELAKSHTRANWTVRPLPEEYLQYAAEDVEYLLPAHEELTTRLNKLGRVQWAESDSRLLLEPELYDIDPNKAISRLKGARNLRGRQRSAAMRLTAWRELQALKRDRPRQWILRDNVLVDIAFRLPGSEKELAQIDSIPAKLVQRVGKDIVAAVAMSSNDSSDYRPPGPPEEEQKLLLKKMQLLVAECANDLGIAAETIASKKELSAVIIGGVRESRVFNGWRKDVIGDQLATLL